MTDKQIAEAKARCEKATPGPWTGATDEVDEWWGKYPSNAPECVVIDAEGMPICSTSDDGIATEQESVNADFIAHARTDLPMALKALEEARADGKAAYDDAVEHITGVQEKLSALRRENDALREALLAQVIATKRIFPMVTAREHETFSDTNGNEDTRTEAARHAFATTKASEAAISLSNPQPLANSQPLTCPLCNPGAHTERCEDRAPNAQFTCACQGPCPHGKDKFYCKACRQQQPLADPVAPVEQWPLSKRLGDAPVSNSPGDSDRSGQPIDWANKRGLLGGPGVDSGEGV